MNYNTTEDPAYLAGLNEQQQAAVLSREDIVYVNAGAGSGKTMLLVAKMIDYIVASDAPQKIVALSYTNTAARQIGERFCRQVAQYGITTAYELFNGTIHSFCFRMMKAFEENRGRGFEYTILDEEELRELREELREELQGAVSLDVYKARLKVISVEDILTLFLRMLDEEPLFRAWMGSQVTVMAIDEAQDLSEANYEILDKLLSAVPGLKLFLVGDPRQNIFEFNGGSYKHLDAFLAKYPHGTRNLTITYRFGQEIADYVNTFRFIDCENHPMQSYAKAPSTVDVRRSPAELEEAREVIDGVKEQGSLSSCAVLCNNLRYLETLIRELKQEKIPFRVFGGRKLVKRHIRFLNHILRILDTENPYSIGKIARYAGIDIVEGGRKRKSRFFASELGQLILSIREDCAAADFQTLVACVIERIMRDPNDDEAIGRDYDSLLLLSRQYRTIADYLMAFASDKETFSAFYRKDYEDCEDRGDGDFLTLSTIHSAKGLEWDHVFVMGLCEGNFPNPYFCKDKPDAEKEAFFNNEWKKMYVAATRAKRSLVLTYASSIRRKGFSFVKSPSRFIADR